MSSVETVKHNRPYLFSLRARGSGSENVRLGRSSEMCADGEFVSHGLQISQLCVLWWNILRDNKMYISGGVYFFFEQREETPSRVNIGCLVAS